MSIVRKMAQANDYAEDPEFHRQREAAKADKARIHQAACARWLESHGVHRKGMTQDERRSATRAFAKKLGRSSPVYQGDPKAWAKSLKSDYLDGVNLHRVQIEMASEALGEVWSGRKCEERKAA